MPWTERLIARYEDPERRARLLRLLYWISLAFTFFGFAVILWTLWRRA